MQYNHDKFLLASARAFGHAKGIDKAIARAQDDVNAWAKLAILGIKAGKLTLDAVKEQLIHDYRLSLPAKEGEDFDPDSAKLSDCSSTVKSWYYFLVRIVNAGDAAQQRVLEGEGMTKVAKSCQATQAQKKGKRAANKNGDKAKKLPSLNASASALISYIDAAMVNTDKAMELANNKQIATLVAKLAELERKVLAVAEKQQNAA